VTTREEAICVAELFYKQLSHRDFDPTQHASLEHVDGSQLFFRYAKILTWKEWFFVYTENHGYWVYKREDIVWIRNAELISKAIDIIEH
jgi:hypothetical protein